MEVNGVCTASYCHCLHGSNVLRVLVCQACIGIPQTDSDSSLYVSTLLFSSSCLESQRCLQVKISMGSYLIFFHPVFHLLIIGYLGSQQVKTLSFAVLCCFNFTLIFWIYPYNIQKQAAITRIIEVSIWKRRSINHAFCSPVQRKYYSPWEIPLHTENWEYLNQNQEGPWWPGVLSDQHYRPSPHLPSRPPLQALTISLVRAFTSRSPQLPLENQNGELPG